MTNDAEDQLEERAVEAARLFPSAYKSRKDGLAPDQWDYKEGWLDGYQAALETLLEAAEDKRRNEE